MSYKLPAICLHALSQPAHMHRSPQAHTDTKIQAHTTHSTMTAPFGVHKGSYFRVLSRKSDLSHKEHSCPLNGFLDNHNSPYGCGVTEASLVIMKGVHCCVASACLCLELEL